MTRRSPVISPFANLSLLSLVWLVSAACSTTPVPVEAPTPKPASVVFDVPVDPIVIMPLSWYPLSDIVTPVKGTDGKLHLAYELAVTNLTPGPLQITSVDVVDPARSNQVFGANRVVSVKDEDVTGMVRLFGRPGTFTKADYVTEVPGLQSGLLYINVIVEDGTALPSRLKHRITVKPTQGGSAPATGISGLVRVSEKQPIVLGPVFKGDGWLDANGCCTQIGPHRYTILPSNGRLQGPEHYAIDFVRLDAQGRAVVGDTKKLENWPYYKVEILAAAAGKVTDAVDGLKDQVPGAPPSGISAETAAGNHVIIDMGEGRYAMYAHLVPGSVRVKVGDQVTRGQVIGLLGNSGNTDAPHLHFQVTDRPSPLDAVGLPFVFEEMEFQGQATGSLDDVQDAALGGRPLVVTSQGRGIRRLQMPLNKDLIGFK